MATPLTDSVTDSPSGWLDVVFQKLGSSSSKERRAVVTQTLIPALQSDEITKSPEDLLTLCRILLLAAIKYNDRKMRLLVTTAMNTAAAQQSIQRNFIIAYISVLAELKKSMYPTKKQPNKPTFSLETHYLFFSCITNLLDTQYSICKAIGKDQWLAQAQLTTLRWLEAYPLEGRPKLNLISRSICKIFARSLSQASDDLWNIYVNLYTEDKKQTLICATSAALIASASPNHSNTSKKQFVEAFQKILLSPNPPANLTTFSYGKFLASLDSADVDEMLQVIKRAFARNPKAATNAGLEALNSMKIDVDKDLPLIFEILKPALKLDVEDILKLTTNQIASFFGKIKDRAVAIATIQQIATFVEDRSLKDVPKISLLSLLSKLVGFKECSSAVANSLLSIFKTANNAALKSVVVNTLSAWMSVAEDLPSSVVTFYKGISQTANRSILLKSLSEVLMNKPLRKQATELFPELLKILSKAPKPAERIDYMTGLLCAIELCSEDLSYMEKLANSTNSFFIGDKSYFFTSDFFNKDPEYHRVMATLCFVVLAEQKVVSLEKFDQNLLDLLCKFTIQPRPAIQYLATDYLIQLGSSHAAVGKTFLETMDQFLRSASSQKDVARPSARTLNQVIRSILKRIDVPLSFYPDIILLISHPLVTSRPQDIQLFWGSLELIQPIGLQTELFEEITNAIVSRCISYFDLPLYKSAAYCAAQFVATEFPKIINGMTAKFIQGIQENKVQELSEREIEIYRTPEGELYDTSITEKKYQSRSESKKPEEKREQNTLRISQQHQAGNKKQKKPSAKGQGPTKEEIEREKVNKQLQAEQTIRERVRSRTNATTVYFQLLTRIFQSNGKHITPQDFATVSDLVLLLLNHATVRVPAASCHVALANCTSFSKTLGTQIGVLTQQIFDDSPGKYPYSELADTLVSVLRKLLALAEAKPLDIPSFIYATPLIETGLLRPTTFKVQQNAMTLFEIHAKPSYPPGRSIAALLKAIKGKMMPERAEACIVKYCECEVSFFPKELMDGCYSESPEVRHASLSGISELDALDDDSLATLDVSTTLWFVQHEGVPANEALAKEIWAIYEQPLFQDFSLLYKLFASPSVFIRKTAGKALAQIVRQNSAEHPEIPGETLRVLMNFYQEYLPPEPVVGVRGLEFAEDIAVIQRQGVSLALEEFAIAMDSKDVIPFFEFLCGSPLIDGDDTVRQAMIQAGIRVAEHFGEEQHELMLQHFEKCLNDASHAVSGTLLREAIVIFLGSLAKKFDLGVEKTCVIVDRLIQSLETPSEQVQETISECLSPLLKPIKSELPKFLDLLFNKLQNSKETHQRRGAAYGIAAFGKGLGVPGLSQLGIMDKLKELLENKRSIPAREGGLFAFECLSKRMKRGFEASAISKLENLLNCCGDNSPVVRDAATKAAREIMSQLSNHGVKRVVPALVKALGDRAWRTQTSAAELLGSMAFCAPKQLSACLPEIVTPLIESLASTHIEVQKCSKKALGHIASVVRNPEIQTHIPILLKALDNPTVYLEDALDNLIKTNYVHVIDAPSLALLMPILQRGLHSSRSTSSKKKAAQIIGNMTKLADHKDLIPYLAILVPELMNTLVDLIPETRAVSAAALGYLVRGLGEERFPDLVDNLYKQLRNAEGGIVFSGAAQGLAQVFSSLDISRFETFLPTMLLNANDPQPGIREGAINFFVFTPGAFGKRLETYLPRILPAVLQGLADESEGVREAAMRAGQAIIAEYGNTSLQILLPLLEGGLFHFNYRIRLSSVTLLSDLLNKITGADIEAEEGNVKDSSESAKILHSVLGEEKLHSVLSALYLSRSDVVRSVQQQALLTWKAAVHNTPTTLRKILPILLKRIINCLGSSNEDKRTAGSKTLGDLVQKLPDMILPTIVPIIEKGLLSDSVDTRLGVCLGLAEIVKSSRRHILGGYLDNIIPCVRLALCDQEEEVREAATITFDSLFTAAGSRIIDEILPKLLEEIHDNNSQTALMGLRDILGVRAKVILPHLVPYLLSEPITQAKCNALVSMAEVSGTSLYSHLTLVFNSLLPLLSSQPEILKVIEAIVVSVKKEGIHILLSDILRFSKSTEPIYRQQGAAEMMYILADKSTTDYSSYISQILNSLLENFNHHNEEVLKTSLKALTVLIKKIPTDNLPNYVPELERQLRAYLQAFSQGGTKELSRYLPGFSLPKGLTPLLTMALQGLRFGTPGVRETSAVCLDQMIQLTDPACMRPYVALIAGPLIRVMGDRFSESVKAAILKTMGQLLDSCGQFCKPFVNQLQTTFIRSLNDPSEKVRSAGAINLGKLMIVSTRIDQLVTELLNTFNTADVERKGTLLTALANVLKVTGSNVSEKILLSCEEKAITSLVQLAGQADIISPLGDVLAITFNHLPPERFEEINFFDRLRKMSDLFIQSSVLNSLLEYCPSRIGNHEADTIKLIGSIISSSDHTVRLNGGIAVKLISEQGGKLWDSNRQTLIDYWVTLISDPTAGNKLQALEALKDFAKRSPSDCEKHLQVLVPMLMERVKDRTSLPVKLAAERTLFYVLQVKSNPSVLTNYAAQVGAADARPVLDYCKRVLSKLTEDD